MISGKKNALGIALLMLLMAVTGVIVLRGQPLSLLGAALKQLQPQYILLALGFMFAYVSCEALCTKQILGRLGHAAPFGRCLGYSFVGFYVSSITPSATGGQPAQIYYMSRDQIPAAHGALNMMLIAACYQIATLLWGGAVWFFVPGLSGQMRGGLAVLLLYGGSIMIALTAGMAMVMFLPHAARKICGGVLRLLAKLRIIKNPQKAWEKLELQLAEYAKGAQCIKKNPGLTLRVLALCLVQLGMLFSVPWAVYLAFGQSGYTWAQVAGTQALVTLAVCNLPLPGVVGPAEGSFVSAFQFIFGAALVTPAMLVSRGISFYTFLLLSAGMAVAVHLRTSREIRERTLREMTANSEKRRVKAVKRYLNTRSGPEGMVL